MDKEREREEGRQERRNDERKFADTYLCWAFFFRIAAASLQLVSLRRIRSSADRVAEAGCCRCDSMGGSHAEFRSRCLELNPNLNTLNTLNTLNPKYPKPSTFDDDFLERCDLIPPKPRNPFQVPARRGASGRSEPRPEKARDFSGALGEGILYHVDTLSYILSIVYYSLL